jgi:hypothetical protein
MVALEAGVLSAARAVVQRAAKVWLADRDSVTERSSDLSELVALRVRDRFRRRSLERQIEEITDVIAQRLEPLSRREFAGLSDNERTAALLAVVEAFAVAELSDEALFAADLDASTLTRTLCASAPIVRASSMLSEPATRLLDLVLGDCCACYLKVVTQLTAFVPRASVETLERLSRLGEQVGLILDRLPAPPIGAETAAGADREFEVRYLQAISNRLAEIELFGIDLHRFRPSAPLTVAYISLTAATPATTTDREQHRRSTLTGSAGQQHWHSQLPDPESGAVRVETALARHARVFLRGEAGSGKSTLLAWLAVTAARGQFRGPLSGWNGCVPFLVKLRSYADLPLPPPEHFLNQPATPIAGVMPTGWVQRLLSVGRGLLLIDGLDELPPRGRRAVRDWVAGLASAFPAARVLVTSRPGAAATDWLTSHDFTTIMLEPMGPADVRALIRHWHDAVRDTGNLPCPVDQLPGYEASLLARLDAAPHMRTLATSPLLCAMLCALNLDRRTHLPRDRMSVYAAAISMLLERRDTERGLPHPDLSLSLRDTTSLIQDLAWRLSLNNRSELPTDQAREHIGAKLATMPHGAADAAAVLAHLLLRSGVLRESAPGRIDFIHRTFQEYLTAREAAEEAHIGLLLQNAHLDQWRNVVIMAAGHANGPLRNQLLGGLLDLADQRPRQARRLATLAAGCLETVPSLEPQLRTRIDDRLGALLPPVSMPETRQLSSIGEPLLPRLPVTLDQLGEASAAATVRLAALINTPEALGLLVGYAADPRRRVQREIIRAWEYFDPYLYAQTVLAHAPLHDGTLEVDRPALLPAARYLHKLRSLKITLREDVDPKHLAGLPAVTQLWLDKAREVDLAPFAKYATLTFLALPNTKRVSNPAALDKLRNLTALWLPIDDPLPDSTVLARLSHLTDLWIGDIPVDARSTILSGLPKLTMLSFAHNQEPPDAALISSLPKLTYLATQFLGNDTELRRLVDPMTSLRSLRDVGLWECRRLTDITPLTSLGLNQLRLIGASMLTDLGPLADLPTLQSLMLSDSPAADLTPVGSLTSLRALTLSNCSASMDLSPLAALPRLRHLFVQCETELDLTPLAPRRGLELWLNRGQSVQGLDEIRPNVRVNWTTDDNDW